MRRKTHKPEDIGHIVDKVIKKLAKKGPGTREEILEIWNETAGSQASKHTRPAGFRQRVLTIEVDSSTWLYSLNLKKKKILEEIKEKLGGDKIKDVRLKIGEIS